MFETGTQVKFEANLNEKVKNTDCIHRSESNYQIYCDLRDLTDTNQVLCKMLIIQESKFFLE